MRQFIIPYLMFEDSLEVANYYKEIFDGEIKEIMYGKDMPEFNEYEKDKIMHLELKINDQYLYLFNGHLKPNSQAEILLNYQNLEDLEKAYNKMISSGRVIQELDDVFWKAKFAVVEDKYGMIWNFHYMENSD